MRSRAMRTATVRYIWDRLKVGLWFVPLVMALVAFFLSWLLGWVDKRIPNELLNNSKFIISGTASEMRLMMIGIAGTVLATTGVVFSLLTLPLSTVASQYGSRLLRIFLRDRTTQFVLGIFVATFCFCLATALSIPFDSTQVEAPQISVTFGLGLALATFASLILLIQHIGTMLQAPNIVAAAGEELMEVVGGRISGEAAETQQAAKKSVIDALVESEAYPLQMNRKGYIQFVDVQSILNLANERDLIIRLLRKPGQFVWPGETAAIVWPSAKVNARLAKHLRRAFRIGNQRTPTQDLEYAVNQLVEIAVRAMSPAINDPFTAMTCLDYIGNGLALFSAQDEESSIIYDRDRQLRIVYEPVTLEELLSAAFDMLRHASCNNASILLHMLKVIESVGRKTKSCKALQELLLHVNLIQSESQDSTLIERDRRVIQSLCEELQKQLAASVGQRTSTI